MVKYILLEKNRKNKLLKKLRKYTVMTKGRITLIRLIILLIISYSICARTLYKNYHVYFVKNCLKN